MTNQDEPTNDEIRIALKELARCATKFVDLWHNTSSEQFDRLNMAYPFDFNFETMPLKIYDWLHNFKNKKTDQSKIEWNK